MAIRSNRTIQREALERWEAHRTNIRRSTPIYMESPEEQLARVGRLKGDFIAFCQYYFPNYAQADFAPFQKRFARKVIEGDKLYIVRAWAREHAKSVIAGLFLPLYLMFTGRMKNMLLVSHSWDNACELLMPIMLNLESNERIIHDFGLQKGVRGWEIGRFVTRDGASFRAIGAGQSPRGTRNEEKRPDFVLVDDIDTDEESRNQTRIDKKWNWIEQALFPAMSISGVKRFVLVGNIISKESIIVKASRMADDYEQINITDKHGIPSWKERYSKEDVAYMLSKISYASAQKEYFNNPISVGTVFKDISWGKVPPLKSFKYLCAYCDPSYKDSKKGDFKALVLVGETGGTFYIIKAFVDQTTIARLLDAWYDMDAHVNGVSSLYNYIEAGSLQDTFYQELFLPKLIDAGKSKGKHLSIGPDHRSKPDKFTRIEATLEPLNRQGRLVFNESEKTNPHMLRLEEQLKAIEPSLPAHDDGPDAIEGAVWIINHKLRIMAPPKVGQVRRSKYKY